MSLLTFSSPGLAIAAGMAVAVPVAIHLLMRRRRKPVEWAAMELLREALRRVERKRRVERWLLLAVRCLLVICAGLAIAAFEAAFAFFNFARIGRTLRPIRGTGSEFPPPVPLPEDVLGLGGAAIESSVMRPCESIASSSAFAPTRMMFSG